MLLSCQNQNETKKKKTGAQAGHTLFYGKMIANIATNTLKQNLTAYACTFNFSKTYMTPDYFSLTKADSQRDLRGGGGIKCR